MDGAGSMGSAMLFWGIAFILMMWVVIKIARTSALMAFVTFVFWPVSLIYLLRGWGDPDNDIRVPFFGAVLASVIAFFMMKDGVDSAMQQVAYEMSDEELALIADEDPALHARLMELRRNVDLESISTDDSTPQYDSNPEPRASASEADRAGLSSPAATPAVSIDPAVELAQTAAALSYYYGEIELAAAHSTLQLPSRWRMVMANRLHRIARLRGLSLEPGTLGWISHEDVDLGRASGWAVELRFLPVGYVPLAASDEDLEAVLAGLAGATLPDGSGRSLGSAAFAPSWDPATETLSWFVDDATGLGEHHAARPLRDGVLLMVVRRLAPERREAALRATRLLSASVRVAPAWTHARGRSAPDAQSTSVLDWMQGARLEMPAKPAAMP
jgi:hypothetical protein